MSENPLYYDLDFLDHIDELTHKRQADEFIIKRETPMFSYTREFNMTFAVNSGVLMNNEEARVRITELLKLIIKEYKRLVKD